MKMPNTPGPCYVPYRVRMKEIFVDYWSPLVDLSEPGPTADLQANKGPQAAHAPEPRAELFNFWPNRPPDHPRFFKIWIERVEIDPKSIYVHILKPHPDRAIPELVKNHQKSSKSQHFRYFSKFLSHGSSSNATERSTTCNISIFLHFFQVPSIPNSTTRFGRSHARPSTSDKRFQRFV